MIRTIKLAKPLKSPEITARTSLRSSNQSTTPPQTRRHPSQRSIPSVQTERNWRLNAGGFKPVAVSSGISSPSTPKPALPSRPRFGIRSILRKSLSTTPTIPTSLPLPGIMNPALREESVAPSSEEKQVGDNPTVKENRSNDAVESSVPVDWMEDDHVIS
ncbi:hypothetical protein Aperf_G00000034381 [Anoplocephala perfoliata]